MPLRETAGKLRGGTLRARDLVEQCLSRIDEWQPITNAFIEVDADAQASDAAGWWTLGQRAGFVGAGVERKEPLRFERTHLHDPAVHPLAELAKACQVIGHGGHDTGSGIGNRESGIGTGERNRGPGSVHRESEGDQETGSQASARD